MKSSSTTKDIRTFSKNEQLVRERREQIAAAASRVFYAKGFRDCSVSDLCKACGLTPGGLYRYIGSKKDILRLMAATVVEGSQHLRERANRRTEESAEEVLRDFIKEYFRGCDKNRQANLFFSREIAHFDEEDRRRLMQDQVAILDSIQSILRRGEETGEFEVDSPVFVAHAILMMGHDWGLRRWYLSQHFTLDDYTDKALDFLLAVLRVSPSVAAGQVVARDGFDLSH